MSASSSSSPSQWEYDVFLSFSGEDTRKGFTGHLYSCLIDRGVIPFRDDPKLEKGTNITPELLKAIAESWCSIIVFSKKYASSNWCLDELVEILKQQKQRGHKVFPVFYNVEPCELRKQKGSIQSAFAEHEKRYNQETTQRWRDALYQSSCITGWELKDRYESEFVQEIVRKILAELYQTRLTVPNDLVGTNSRLADLLYKIDFGEHDVRIVGICGMGGIGKTTLARVVYTQMPGYFEGKCFLAGVREVQMNNSGLVSLQEQLLSKIFPGEMFRFPSVYDGIEVMSRRLHHKKVLIVIDDADNMQHLKCLAENRDWFGLGSRIIITTRDEHLLRAYGVDDIYMPTKLNSSEALQLLRLKAFKGGVEEDNCRLLSISVVQYADGLPLALEVLGSFLCGRDASQWRSAIESLKSEPNKEITNCLQMSFDGLSETQKKIFLDIAHFFKGLDKDFITKILDGCGYNPGIGLCVLTERSLITVEDNIIEMHDLLQEMGRNIVRQQSLDEPGKRCRLAEESDVYQVLIENKATEAIEGIVINSITWEQNETFTLSVDAFLKMMFFCPCSSFMREQSEPSMSIAYAFSKMTKLRLLIVRGLLSFNLNYLSKELRLFDWPGCPLKSLPSSFQPDNLVALILPNSCIERLWGGKRPLNKLKVVDLKDSTKLIKTPDFTIAKNLESLELESCTNLVEVHPSIASLPKPKLLNLTNCTSLRSLPTKIGMQSLQTLILSGCSKLENLPDCTMSKNLKSLELEGCTSLVHVHSSNAFLQKLKLLNLRNCASLRSLPTKIGMESLETLILSGCSNLQRFPEIAEEMECLLELYLDGTGIEELPSSFALLNSLVILDLKDCRNLVRLPSSINGLKCLIVLNISGCSKLESLPNFTMNENLENLILEGCTSLVDVHPSIASLQKLKLLNLRNCRSLRNLPTEIGMESLETLILSGCSKFQRFPKIIDGKMECLLELYLDGTFIEELPSSIEHLSSLQVLDLSGSSQFENVPTFFIEKLYRMGREALLSSLNAMLFRKSPNPMAAQMLPCLSGLSSLKELNISGRNLCEGALLSDICCLSSLETLILSDNNFVSLPTNLCQLTKLLRLELAGCKKLESLPELPSSITTVGIDSCTSLATVPNPTKAYIPSQGSLPRAWSRDGPGTHYYAVNCFKLAANGNAFRMLKGHLKAAAKARIKLDILIPGSEIPGWFSLQHDEVDVHRGFYTSCAPIRMALLNDDQWMGIALCCVVEPASNDCVPPPGYKELQCGGWIESAGASIAGIDTGKFQFKSMSGHISKNHLWLRYLPREELERSSAVEDCNIFELSFRTHGPKVKKLGARIVYPTDIQLSFRTHGPKVKKLGARIVYPTDIQDLDRAIQHPTTRIWSPSR